ncbi:hypothetical protein [Flavobacterium sp.]
MTTLTLDWKTFLLLLIVILWIMKNEKVKVIFGEIRKTLQILPLTKIAQAIITFYRNKDKDKPEP